MASFIACGRTFANNANRCVCSVGLKPCKAVYSCPRETSSQQVCTRTRSTVHRYILNYSGSKVVYRIGRQLSQLLMLTYHSTLHANSPDVRSQFSYEPDRASSSRAAYIQHEFLPWQGHVVFLVPLVISIHALVQLGNGSRSMV